MAYPLHGSFGDHILPPTDAQVDCKDLFAGAAWVSLCQNWARLSSLKKVHGYATWRLADAKNRFSELVNRALTEGPQQVLRRDDAVILLGRDDYEKLLGVRASFKQFLLAEGPSLDGLDLQRDRSPMRDVDL